MESPTVDADPDLSLTSSEISEIPALHRANRFQGPRSTWRNLTADDRLVSTSLTALRNRDLSIHLYNAHAMKSRLYGRESVSVSKPWASKDRWCGSRPGEQDESSESFVPPKIWAAWPLSANVVPRTGEQVGPLDGAEDWTLKGDELQMPSRELEEILMAITLRISKDRFERRELSNENDSGMAADKTNDVNIGLNSGLGVEYEMASREPLQEMPQDSLRSDREAMSGTSDASQSFSGHADVDGVVRDYSQKSEERLDGFSIPNEGSETSPKNIPILERPIVSADDEKSTRLLRPTIRHTLSRLDDLLIALHHARQSCFYYGSEHTESQSDFESGGVDVDADVDIDDNTPSQHTQAAPIDEPLEQPSKRLRPGRPPKILHIPAPSMKDTLETIEPHKMNKRGRKRKIHVSLQGESHEEMLVRIARQQKKAMPFTVPTFRSASSSPTKSVQSSPQRRGTSAQAQERRSMRLGLRDWSEVLGTAALVGFSSNVINRAMQRCTSLFGEGMTMHSLVENPRSGNEDRIVDYLPSEIPDFDSLYSSTATELEADDEGNPRTGRRPFRRRNRSNQRSSPDKMDVSKSEVDPEMSSDADAAYHCPYSTCLRHKKGFTQKGYLSKHLERVHKLDKEGAKELLEDSGEEMEGGVHIDGFMKEVKRRTGWRALDGRPRLRNKSTAIVQAEEEPREHEEGSEVQVLSNGSSSGRDLDEKSLDEAFESD